MQGCLIPLCLHRRTSRRTSPDKLVHPVRSCKHKPAISFNHRNEHANFSWCRLRKINIRFDHVTGIILRVVAFGKRIDMRNINVSLP